jgi:drug/metabolite transporter (DMT)-like permease
VSAHAGSEEKGRKAKLLLAFASVYVVWGSTYLAIKFAVETIPPYLKGSARFIVSGLILYAWARARGAPRPSRREWRDAAIVGTLLLAGGNGAVGWAEQKVPSGITALLVASVPLWMVLIDWARPSGKRPRGLVIGGLLLGLVGVGVLAAPGMDGSSRTGSMTVGAIALVLGSISWAAGSIYGRHSARPESGEMATGLQMLTGSVALAFIGAATGELGRFHFAAVTSRSFLGWAYLVTFGSLIGFTAYIYLLKATTPAKATTYAYVNPIVAVLLGWAVAGEAITARTLAAAGIILASVAVISLARPSAAED